MVKSEIAKRKQRRTRGKGRETEMAEMGILGGFPPQEIS